MEKRENTGADGYLSQNWIFYENLTVNTSMPESQDYDT